LGIPAGDLALDYGRGNDLIIKNNGEALIDILSRDSRKSLGAGFGEM
jgi:hypothetical protein